MTQNIVLTQKQDQDGYLAHLMDLTAITLAVCRSTNTRANYQVAIEQFIVWSKAQGAIRLTAESLAQYQSHLASRPGREGRTLSASSVNVKMAAVRGLVHSAVAKGWLAHQDAAAMLSFVKTRPAAGQRKGKRLEVEQVRGVLEIPDRKTLKGKRDYAILLVLFAGGLRRAELCNLLISSISPTNGAWSLVDIIGKRNKVRSVPMNDETHAALTDWLQAAEITEGRVFRPMMEGRLAGDSLRPNKIWDKIRRYTKMPGFPNGISPHDARRTCAYLLHKAGGDIRQIQYLLGHDSLETTSRYIGAAQELGKKAVTSLVHFG